MNTDERTDITTAIPLPKKTPTKIKEKKTEVKPRELDQIKSAKHRKLDGKPTSKTK